MGGRLGRIEWGGPDLEPRRLRHLLEAQVEASPPRSRIDWATYYFRDRALAAALMRASDRGVRVRLVLEGSPRRPDVNAEVISMLREHGLGGGFSLYLPSDEKPGYLHAKIYAFSHPAIAWIGSFNPSGDDPEDPQLIADIGDQDRGHNLLLGVERPRLVRGLRRHVARLGSTLPRPRERWRPWFNRVIRSGGSELYFYPRLRTFIVERDLAALGERDRVCGAVSHMKPDELSEALIGAARRGTRIDLLVHDTERRVTSDLLAELKDAGATVRRVHHPDGLPMHAKFLIVERGGEAAAWVGSYNYNRRSRLQNAEVLLRTRDADIVAQLGARFGEIAAMAAGHQSVVANRPGLP